MATIALPTPFKKVNISVRRSNFSALSVSPWTGSQQAQRLPGALWFAEFTLPPMEAAEGRIWVKFLDDLQGVTNTFNLNINDFTTGSGGPGTIAMRLVSPDFEYSVGLLMHNRITFQAMEAVSV